MGETTLFASDRTRVVRVLARDGAPRIRKEFSGPDAERRLRHEAAVLRRLAGVPGVPELIEVDDERHALLLADLDSVPMPAGPVEPAEVIRLGAGIATIIAALHDRGVIHKDVNPSNVRLAGPGRTPVLIDYDLAGTYPVERPSFTHHTDISGALPYLAPEQTGRTGWPVDQRADLYALGATLYELATGGTPFGDGDPLTLIHDHLTRTPVAPSALVPAVPPMLSKIICHLLEKDPERRYQSAEGVLADLLRVGAGEEAPIGERDFPWQLTAPSRLIGREEAVAGLATALDAAIRGSDPVLMVSGPSGVGKSALIDELRPLVTAAGGWFVSGKYDQYRQDPDADGLRQAFRAIARLLLAEPQDELVRVRGRLITALGDNAGRLAAVVPEFSALLGVPPATEKEEDLLLAQGRLHRAAIQALRVLADPRRPLVVVVDDLQWAPAAPIRLFDEILTDGGPPGILLVGAYRDGETDTIHRLSALLARPVTPRELRLANLPGSGIRELAGGMLRGPVDRLDELAELIGTHTGGNPFAAVEFVNALRHGRALTPVDGGWRFDPGARWLIGRPADVATLLAAEVGKLTPAVRRLVEMVSCLSGDLGPEVLGRLGGPAEEVLEELRPALENGFLVPHGSGPVTLQFRHDQIRQAVYAGMPAEVRTARHLLIARRLAPVDGFAVVAAEQYLAVLPSITDPAEAHQVSQLLHEAAAQARTMARYAVAERLLDAAATLAGRTGGLPGDRARRWAIDAERQNVLIALGRFDEADVLYESLGRDCTELLTRSAADLVQMTSLIMRNRPLSALQIGFAALAAWGHTLPGGGSVEELMEEMTGELVRWSAGSAEEDLAKGRNTDPGVTAQGYLLTRAIQAAVFAGSPVLPWLLLIAARLWDEHGPSPALTGPLGHAMFVTVPRGDYTGGYAIVRRVMEVSDAMAAEPDATFVRVLHAVSVAPWFVPLTEAAGYAREAHERLVNAGDRYNAGFTWYVTSPILFDCGDDLAGYRAETDRGIAYAAGTGNGQAQLFLQVHRAAADFLTEPDAATLFDDDTCPPGLAASEQATVAFHTMHALIALIRNDGPALARHSALAIDRLPAVVTSVTSVHIHFVRAMALIAQARATEGPEQWAAVLLAFDEQHAWVALRAVDAPANYAHLDAWLQAERAWATGDFQEAVRWFDWAEYAAESRARPWHRALIAERRARLLMDHGIEYGARLLIQHAAQRWRQWGAERKVAELTREFPFVDPGAGRTADGSAGARSRTTTISAETVDLLAVLRVCQAISRETSIERLTDQVNDLLCGLTGATAARLILRDRESGGWFLPSSDEDIPLSVLRYVERTREPLVIDDAKQDDRFAHDPFLRPLDQLALLVVPILTAGEPTSVLLLENTGSRGAFGHNRLDTVSLLAGQLSVSITNALLYADLERKVTDRTRALAEANAKLEILAATDPLTGLPNRRRLEETLGGRPAAVAMIDVDHFKLYNDRYGHRAGDDCLVAVAQLISANIRETDVVIRYGGEEFTVILAAADATIAQAVAERIRAAIDDAGLPHAAAPNGRVTVSIGVAAGDPEADEPPKDLLGAADACLYAAKSAGRNQVVASAA